MKKLQALILFFILILFFQGKGSHAVFLLILCLIPVLSPSYRKTWVSQRKKDWESLRHFSEEKKWRTISIRSVFWFGAFPVMFFSLVNGINISSMDNFPTSLIAASLVTQGDTELSEFPPAPGVDMKQICLGNPPIPYYYRCTNGGIYSSYPFGMVLISFPFTLISRLVGGEINNGKNQWRLAKWASAWVAGLCASLFLLLALLVVPVEAAWMGTLFLSLGSPFLGIIGQGLWSQGGVVLGLLAVLLLEYFQTPKTNYRILILQAVCLSFMMACRISAAALIIPVGLWIFARSWKRGLTLTGLSLILVAPLVLYYEHVYHHPLGPQMLMANTQVNRPSWEPIYGNLFSPATGLFLYQPWGLLFLFFKKQKNPFNYLMLIGAIALSLFVLSFWKEWWSGSYGTRYFTEIIPLLALLLLPTIAAFWQKKQTRPVLFFLLALSFLMQGIGVYGGAGMWFNKMTDRAQLYDWYHPPFLYPFQK